MLERTQQQQTVAPAEEPLRDVYSGEGGVGTGQLGQKTAHLQLEAVCLGRTCGAKGQQSRVTQTGSGSAL